MVTNCMLTLTAVRDVGNSASFHSHRQLAWHYAGSFYLCSVERWHGLSQDQKTRIRCATSSPHHAVQRIWRARQSDSS